MAPVVPSSLIRCPWANVHNPLMIEYHDQEWGRPVHDDRTHFEMLTLEGAQAGLSWETILNKRACYRALFCNFDVAKVARFSAKKVEKLLTDPGIVRHRLKIESTITNAQSFLNIQKEFGSFDAYVWRFVDFKPIVHAYQSSADCPASTPLSDALARDLKKRGFRFVGTTIMYAYLQAVGLIDDHLTTCWLKTPQVKWSVYILSCKDGSLYTGITQNVAKRLAEHQAQGAKCAKYLRGKAPLKLVFQQSVGTRAQALKIEWKIKNQTRKTKQQIIESGNYQEGLKLE